MRERPIILTDWQVRAVLAGTKTQHRVPVRGPLSLLSYIVQCDDPAFWGDEEGEVMVHAPYAPGDRLWVRETWALDRPKIGAQVFYKADGHQYDPGGGWRSPVIMPKWASRITLTVLSVRAELLRDISDADAMAEGVRANEHGYFEAVTSKGTHYTGTPRAAFYELWTRGKGPASWDANPWVWVLEFEKENGDG